MFTKMQYFGIVCSILLAGFGKQKCYHMHLLNIFLQHKFDYIFWFTLLLLDRILQQFTFTLKKMQLPNQTLSVQKSFWRIWQLPSLIWLKQTNMLVHPPKNSRKLMQFLWECYFDELGRLSRGIIEKTDVVALYSMCQGFTLAANLLPKELYSFTLQCDNENKECKTLPPFYLYFDAK